MYHDHDDPVNGHTIHQLVQENKERSTMSKKIFYILRNLID